MGKKHKISNKRENLMSNLKKLSARLEDFPCCQMKPFPCCPCCSNGPTRRECFMVPNASSSRASSTSKSVSACGPFPTSCVNICSFKSRTSIHNAPLCPNPINCYCKRDSGLRCNCKYNYHCYKPRCSRRISNCQCRHYQCNNYCMPNFQLHPCRCRPAICNYPCVRKNSPCSIKVKNCPAGNLCCECNTICLPRSYSDTVMTKKIIKRKSLKCSKSVELRGSTLYRGCDCDKRNGLQDRCLRYCCINNPKCKLNPATCHCSKFSCGKHLSKKYTKRKGHRSYTCYVCEAPTYFTSFMPCYPYPQNKQCCCRKQMEHSDEKECGCQCCPSTHEVQCLCSLDALCRKQTSPSPLEVCCPSRSPCPSPCSSPCSFECPLSCYAPQSSSNQDQFCLCCSEPYQRSSPIMYHVPSNSCCCGQK